MKFTILALLLFVRYQLNHSLVNGWQDWHFRRPFSYGYTGDRLTLNGGREFRNNINKIHCIYNSVMSMIGCNKDAVKCDTVRNLNNLTIKYDILGIEYNNNELRLYPKMFNESQYGSYKLEGNDGKVFSFEIYNVPNENSLRGLHIRDSICFNNIINLFENVRPNITVESVGSTKIAISGYILGV